MKLLLSSTRNLRSIFLSYLIEVSRVSHRSSTFPCRQSVLFRMNTVPHRHLTSRRYPLHPYFLLAKSVSFPSLLPNERNTSYTDFANTSQPFSPPSEEIRSRIPPHDWAGWYGKLLIGTPGYRIMFACIYCHRHKY